jgi:hypothetical protein
MRERPIPPLARDLMTSSGCTSLRSRLPRLFPLTLGAILLVLQAGPAQASVARAYNSFFETSAAAYRGVLAHWVDENWTGIPCPAETFNINRVNTFVNAYG